MPKSYTEKERDAIKQALRDAAMESMLQKGVQKTTVDDLVAKVHIPKGTFYLFYKSKELLLFDALTQREEEMHEQLAARLLEVSASFCTDSLAALIYDFFQLGYSIGILPLMLNGELNVLIRKLPDEIVSSHISRDDEFLSIFNKLFPAMKTDRLADYSAAFRGLFLMAGFKREIGECFDRALLLLIRGLVLQMLEED